MDHSFRRLLCASTAAVGVLTGASAQAAEANTAAPAAVTAGANTRTANATQAPSDATTVNTVVVTANRRVQNVQDVPQQVTAVTASDLSQIHARNLEDVAAFVPGLSLQRETPANNLIAIRGVTTGGLQLSSAVGVYLDDIPTGSSSSFGIGAAAFNINVFDLSRVEVLNGPQGTLYGANALGGVVRYITTPPNLDHFEANGEIEGSITQHGGDNDGLRGLVNIPLLDGKVAIRLDGFQQFNSGYADDPLHGRKGLGSAQAYGGRISILVKPTDDFDLRLSYFDQRIADNGADAAFRDPVTHAPIMGRYDQDYPTQQKSNYSLSVVSAVANWDVHWAKLTSVTGYQQDNGFSHNDVSLLFDPLFGVFGAGSDAFNLPAKTDTSKFTQELRLASHDNAHFEWLVGGYYVDERTTEAVDLLDETNPGGTLLGFVPLSEVLPSTYTEYAVFADATIFLTDRFDLTLGVRYSNNRQSYSQNSTGLLNNFLDPTSFSHFHATSKDSVATYLVNPKYRINDDIMVYARIASGFRPGGPNFVAGQGLGNPSFNPDTLWNYEIGEKSTFLDKRATLDFDLFDIEWSNIQLTANNGGIAQLENGGNARIQGAELSFGYRVLPGLTFGGSAAYTDAKLITTAPALGIGYVGARLPLSPQFNFALVANYDFDIANGYAGSFTVTDRYLGDRTSGFAGSALSPLYKLADYNTVDLGLAIRAPRSIELDFFLKNVFDTAGEVSANTMANQYNPASPVPVTLSLPRTVGLTLKLKNSIASAALG